MKAYNAPKRTRKRTVKIVPEAPQTDKETRLAKELEEIKKLLEQIRDKPAPVIPAPIVTPIWVQPYVPPAPVYPNYPWTPIWQWPYSTVTVTSDMTVSGNLQGSGGMSINQLGGYSVSIGNC